MSYREKAAWISLVTSLVGWGLYFIMLARSVASGGSQAGFVGYPVVFLAVGVILTVWLQRGISKRELEQPDERERVVEVRSSEIAFRALLLMILTAGIAAMICDHALSGITLTEPGYSIFNAALLLVVLSGLVRFAAQIILFRRDGV